MYLLPSPTKSDYKNGICTSRNTKKIQQFNDEYNFLAYYTTLVKCVTKETPRRVELDNCRTRFQKELFEVSPKIIITIGDVKYAYLVDSNDDGNLLIQKIVLKDNEEYYEPLKSKDEYDNALIEFYHKHKDLVDKTN